MLHPIHLVRRKVGADAGHLAAVEGECHPDRALVAAHSQNPTGHAGGADLTQVVLQGMKFISRAPGAPKGSAGQQMGWKVHQLITPMVYISLGVPAFFEN